VILQQTNIGNACYILADATHYRIQPLIAKLQEYICINLETFLECRILDEIPYALVKQLSKFTRQRQTDKSPFARGDAYIKTVLDKHAEWLALQDLPQPTLRHTNTFRKEVSSARLPPVTPIKKSISSTSAASGVASSPTLRRPPSGDDIFLMDEPELQSGSNRPSDTNPVWKAQGPAPRYGFSQRDFPLCAQLIHV
jgi:hypothetical protein